VGQSPRKKLNESKLDKGSRQTGSCTIEKKPHAQGFSPFDGDQSHLPTNVVCISESAGECLVRFRIAIKSSDSALNTQTKARTDFEAFICSAVQNHGRLLGSFTLNESFLKKVLKFFLSCADVIEDN
jgi:hypothetical protein